MDDNQVPKESLVQEAPDPDLAFKSIVVASPILQTLTWNLEFGEPRQGSGLRVAKLL